MMRNYNNPLTEKICSFLAPLVGDVMACGVIKTQATKLGINEDLIAKNHLPLLAENIEKGLVIFIGSEAAQQVSKQIREITSI